MVRSVCPVPVFVTLLRNAVLLLIAMRGRQKWAQAFNRGAYYATILSALDGYNCMPLYRIFMNGRDVRNIVLLPAVLLRSVVTVITGVVNKNGRKWCLPAVSKNHAGKGLFFTGVGVLGAWCRHIADNRDGLCMRFAEWLFQCDSGT